MVALDFLKIHLVNLFIIIRKLSTTELFLRKCVNLSIFYRLLTGSVTILKTSWKMRVIFKSTCKINWEVFDFSRDIPLHFFLLSVGINTSLNKILWKQLKILLPSLLCFKYVWISVQLFQHFVSSPYTFTVMFSQCKRFHLPKRVYYEFQLGVLRNLDTV